MKNKLIITLDGPAGVGKSTLAQLLAEKLNIAFLDTGAMFRSIAFILGDSALQLKEDKLSQKLKELSYTLEGKGLKSHLLCNGKILENQIRNEKVAYLASKYATLDAVRFFLKKSQQEIGKNFSLVAEGRDMGTIIFPQAKIKFFIDADPKIRAMRRFKQLKEQGKEASLQELEKQIKERDQLDRNRKIAPLKAAPDAIIIDSSNLTISDMLKKLEEAVKDQVTI